MEQPIARQSELADLRAEIQALRDGLAVRPEVLVVVRDAAQVARELPGACTTAAHWMALDVAGLMVAWFALLTGYRVVCKLFGLLK